VYAPTASRGRTAVIGGMLDATMHPLWVLGGPPSGVSAYSRLLGVRSATSMKGHLLGSLLGLPGHISLVCGDGVFRTITV